MSFWALATSVSRTDCSQKRFFVFSAVRELHSYIKSICNDVRYTRNQLYYDTSQSFLLYIYTFEQWTNITLKQESIEIAQNAHVISD